jgi:phage portal protein BeeE
VLLAPEEREQLFLEFRVEDLLRGDIKSRFEAYRQAVGSSFMTANEARRLEDLPPIADADALVMQAGQTSGSTADAA